MKSYDLRSPDDPIIRSPDDVILAPSGTNFSGIQLSSSQNDNVMVFFVVHSIFRDETILLISKHLHQEYAMFSTGCGNLAAHNTPVRGRSLPGRSGVGRQFTTQNG